MKLYGLEIDDIPKDQIEGNLKKIYNLQQLRIEAIKLRCLTYLE